MVARSAALDTLRESIVRTAGAYLRNVRWEPGATCQVCAGVTKDRHATCWRCLNDAGHAHAADRVGVVAYAWPGHRSGRSMYAYKDPHGGATSFDLVQSVLTYAVAAHWTCVATPAGGAADGWTFVPSLSGRPGPHPLQRILQPVLRHQQYVPVSVASDVRDPRAVHPENYVVTASTCRHVLVVDDTWVSGAHAQSVSRALKAAGVERVTVLAVARWLTPGFAGTTDLIAGLTDDFDPDVCPYTGGHC